MNILVCYNGDPLAKKVLETGIKMGIAFGAEIHIFASISSGEDSNEVFKIIKDQTEKEIENAKKEGEKSSQIVKKNGLAYKTHISNQGKNPGEDIIDFAKQIEAEQIVVGVRARSRVGKLIFGSTARYVILNSPCPVMTVRV